MESSQEAHYDNIISLYDSHYHDAESEKYREEFLNPHLFKNIDLAGKEVMEAMCGSGACGDFLVRNHASITALDISSNALSIYQEKRPQTRTVHASATKTNLPANTYDIICIVGGLHHLPPHTMEGIKEFHRLLRPNGILCFAEPHDKSLLNIIRKMWYSIDNLFEENEEAINYEELLQKSSGHFQEISCTYIGGPAYIFVLNSMVWRMPKKLKTILSPFLFKLEKWLSPIFSKRFASGMLVAQWRKI
jgi:ubiquinone/menaquinone biosynthesis C-methylase UbiE